MSSRQEVLSLRAPASHLRKLRGRGKSFSLRVSPESIELWKSDFLRRIRSIGHRRIVWFAWWWLQRQEKKTRSSCMQKIRRDSSATDGRATELVNWDPILLERFWKSKWKADDCRRADDLYTTTEKSKHVNTENIFETWPWNGWRCDIYHYVYSNTQLSLILLWRMLHNFNPLVLGDCYEEVHMVNCPLAISKDIIFQDLNLECSITFNRFNIWKYLPLETRVVDDKFHTIMICTLLSVMLQNCYKILKKYFLGITWMFIFLLQDHRERVRKCRISFRVKFRSIRFRI